MRHSVSTYGGVYLISFLENAVTVGVKDLVYLLHDVEEGRGFWNSRVVGELRVQVPQITLGAVMVDKSSDKLGEYGRGPGREIFHRFRLRGVHVRSRCARPPWFCFRWWRQLGMNEGDGLEQ